MELNKENSLGPQNNDETDGLDNAPFIRFSFKKFKTENDNEVFKISTFMEHSQDETILNGEPFKLLNDNNACWINIRKYKLGLNKYCDAFIKRFHQYDIDKQVNKLWIVQNPKIGTLINPQELSNVIYFEYDSETKEISNTSMIIHYEDGDDSLYQIAKNGFCHIVEGVVTKVYYDKRIYFELNPQDKLVDMFQSTYPNFSKYEEPSIKVISFGCSLVQDFDKEIRFTEIMPLKRSANSLVNSTSVYVTPGFGHIKFIVDTVNYWFGSDPYIDKFVNQNLHYFSNNESVRNYFLK